MKRENKLWIILDLIFLVIFNALFFGLGGIDHNASVWISYVFIHFAYIMLLLTPKFIRTGKSSAVFGFSIYFISSLYFLLELITGITFILLSPESFRIPFLVQLCIAGLYGIILVSNLIANERTANAQEKQQKHIDYVKKASVKMKELLDKTQDIEAKKKVEKVYDAIYSSPVKSHPNLEQIEEKIISSINELESVVLAGNKDSIILLADSLLSAINDRNLKLKSFTV